MESSCAPLLTIKNKTQLSSHLHYPSLAVTVLMKNNNNNNNNNKGWRHGHPMAERQVVML